MMHRYKPIAFLAVALLICLLSAVAWLKHEQHQAKLNQLLIAAVDNKDAVAVKSLLDIGADPNTRSDGEPQPPWSQRFLNALLRRKEPERIKGCPILVTAAGWDETAVVQSLLAHGADANARDDTENGMNQTALMYASGNLAVAQALIGHGADVNATNSFHDTVLGLMIDDSKDGNLAIIQTMLARGADVNASNNYGQTMLDEAVLVCGYGHEHPEVVQALIDAGARVNQKDGEGATALIWAAREGYPKAVQVFLKNGADVNAKDGDGKTASQHAAEQRHWGIVALLKQAERSRAAEATR